MAVKPDFIQENATLNVRTTLQVGGPAEYFADVQNFDTLRRAVGWASKRGMNITVLAEGSNVLVNDNGVKGLVINMNTDGIHITKKHDAMYVTVAAGENFDGLIAMLVDTGICGLENLSGIPGSVGAVPIQNVGAYGVEVKDRIASVTAYDIAHDTFVTLSNRECGFGYRDSFFKTAEGKQYVIVLVTFLLSCSYNPILEYRDLKEYFLRKKDPPLSDIRNAVIAIRSNKFPDWNSIGTAGSFFKNPAVFEEKYRALRELYPDLPGFTLEDGLVKIPLGYVLDKILELKGFREGNVGLYEKQALVLVNHGNATSSEIEAFTRTIEQRVLEAIGVKIEREVTSIQ